MGANRKYKRGGISIDGYKANSRDNNRDYNIIPSGRITMQDVPHPIYGIDNLGHQQLMLPGGEYQFPGESVFELPIKSKVMKRMQRGGKTKSPVYVDSPNDPRYKAYQDSLKVYSYEEGIPTGHTNFDWRGYEQAYNSLTKMNKKVPSVSGEPYRKPVQPVKVGQSIQRIPTDIQGNQPDPDNMTYMPVPAMPTINEKGWYSNNQNISVDAPDEEVEKLYNTDGSRKYQFGGSMKKKQGGYSGTYSNGTYFQQGGMVIDPFSPLHRFMKGGRYCQDGGPASPPDPIGGGVSIPGPALDLGARPGEYDPENDPDNPVNRPENRPLYNADYSQNSPSPGYQDDGQQQGLTGRQKFQAWSNIGTNLLGAGMAAAATFANRKNQRDMQAYNRQRGMSSSMPVMNQPGGHGDYTQIGEFRPDQNTPTRAGMFYPGSYQMGGHYAPGQEIEVDDNEIARLKSMGYTFDIIK